MSRCPTCGNEVPAAEINADDRCKVCDALASLRISMEKSGAIHPNLFERQDNRCLPPGDRE